MKIILWKKYGKLLKLWADRLLDCLVACGVVLILWMLLQLTSLASFRIPTDSMQPTLIPGDYILVEKWTMGARIFDLLDAAEGKEVKIRRLPGFGKVERNDVLVFHYPYPHQNDSLSMHLLKYYVKRCIALPGDTMGIRSGHYYIKGIDEPIGNIQAQKRIARLDEEDARGIVMDAYPWDKYISWTIQDFGPLHVPAAGQTVGMDSTAVKLYRNLIEWEQKKKLIYQEKKVFLGDNGICDNFAYSSFCLLMDFCRFAYDGNQEERSYVWAMVGSDTKQVKLAKELCNDIDATIINNRSLFYLDNHTWARICDEDGESLQLRIQVLHLKSKEKVE